MIRICEKCNHVTGQRNCVYCGHGSPGTNARSPLRQSPKSTPTRQAWRARVREWNWDRYRLGPTDHGLPRRERRKMARAFAAGEWRKRAAGKAVA